MRGETQLRGVGRTRGAAVGLIILFSACATRPPQVLTPKLVPPKFVGPATVAAPVWPTAGWWHAFGSPELSNLITLAQADNRDLAAAAARLREARAEVMIQRAALFPQVDLEGEAIRAGVGTAAVQTGSQHVSTGNAFGLNLDGSYDLDVWGLERDNLRSATEALKSSHFAQQAAALTVLAAVADGYFNVLALREQISIAQEDITAIEGILGTIKLKVSAGTASHLDLAQEEAQLESVRAQLPALEELELEARVALAVLLGRPPESFDVQARNCDGIRLPAVAVGLPAQLLLRRPDVAEAEANLAAAHASLQAARAAFLPQIALGGSDGFGSTAVSTLLHGPSALWDAGAQLVQTIFAGGKLVGQKDLAYATQEELVADYQAAVLNAYADVETALGQVNHYAREEEHLRREVDAAREAFGISQLQYRQGVADLLNVLQAQQTLFRARAQLAQAKAARQQALVHLYEALGGGWQELSRERTQGLSTADRPAAR
ncbi:MAG: efflux transporter outer membrane subunit [Steroidobacteraceae bacterium]